MSSRVINRIAVIGTGAVGGYYGAKLANSGADVHFLARSDAELVKSQGLIIESDTSEDIKLDKVNVYSSVEDMPTCDLVLITLKTTANSALSNILSAITDKSSVICSLQNGYGIEQSLAKKFPDNPIIGGLCFICSQKTKPGVINHQDFGSIRFGDYNAGQSTLDAVVKLFSDADIPTQTTPSLEQARWEKLVWNIPFNGLSVLLDANTKEILDDAKTRSLIQSLMEEVVSAANATGCDIADEFPCKLMELTDGMTPYFPSMKGDYDNCRPMEIEAIYDSVLATAKEKGVSMPQTLMLSQQLSYIDHG